ARFKRAMSACCITPAHSLLHASRFTRHKLVAESGVAPDDLLVMSQPSLVPAPSPHQEHAVRIELTMTGFADRRLNQLGYACQIPGASCGNRTRASALATQRHPPRPTKRLRISNLKYLKSQISNLRFKTQWKLWCWRKESN